MNLRVHIFSVQLSLNAMYDYLSLDELVFTSPIHPDWYFGEKESPP